MSSHLHADSDQLKQNLPCKVCGKIAVYFGTVDFNKNCEERHGLFLPPCGNVIHYHQCQHCGLIFTTAMDNFTHADFKTHIYNTDYPQVDPDVTETQPRALSNLITKNFGHARTDIRILDYGCGNGTLVNNLRKAGFSSVEGYDPFLSDYKKPSETFDLILCTEVMEHVPSPLRLTAELAQFRNPAGLILVTTLLQPKDIRHVGLKWWYAAPRNGHITLHTQTSLQLSWKSVGLHCRFAGVNIHIALNTVPDFAKHML